jgi:hypothetical protein
MATNISHVVEFSDAFPIAAIVSTVSTQLSWSKSCMQLCLKCVSGWRGAGCCWGTWMMSDDMKVSKGPLLPVVALPGVGHMPAKGEDEQEVARVFYVAATRAIQKLVIAVSGDGTLCQRMADK